MKINLQELKILETIKKSNGEKLHVNTIAKTARISYTSAIRKINLLQNNGYIEHNVYERKYKLTTAGEYLLEEYTFHG